MKKLLSVFLAVLMIFSVFSLAAFAEDKEEKHVKCPVIFIAGTSIEICDAEGNVIPSGFEVLTAEDDGEDSYTKEQIIETVFNILLPFVSEGLPFDKWDNYGDALYEELAPIWDETQLDGDGNAKYGTGVSKKQVEKWDDIAKNVNAGADGKFSLTDYQFIYDWRLSPYDHVDRLHKYIETVRETTDCNQVALFGRCIGGGLIDAYLEKYGEYGYVKKVFYDEVLSNGCAAISECFSGKIDFSDKHMQAYIQQTEYFGKQGSIVDLRGINDLTIEVVTRLVDLFTQVGVVDVVLDDLKELYDRLYGAFMPSMLLASGFATWGSHWVSVYDGDFEAAIDLIFGKEGSERRTEYAGLIEKLEYIREHLTSQRPDMYNKFVEEYKVQFGVMASYGLADAPIIEHHDETGDTLAGIQDSSFGATSAGLFTTLSEKHIEEKVAAGKGDYISPDKKIDASTCLFPETTWFLKNNPHNFNVASGLAEYFTQYDNVTVSSNKRNYSRFLIIDSSSPKGYSNMTEDNCADGPWLDVVEQEPTIATRLAALMRLLTVILEIITMLMNGGSLFGL